MGKKRPARTERRTRLRDARELVRDRERLAALSAGGSAARPISIDSVAVIDSRVGAERCPQCGGTYVIADHRAPAAGLRELAVTCRTCHVSRTLWFRLGSSAPS